MSIGLPKLNRLATSNYRYLSTNLCHGQNQKPMHVC